jgi:hypothetical protein
MGKWLCDWIHQANERLDEALKIVENHPCGLGVDELLGQLKEQWDFQSKSIDCQSRTKGACTIEKIISLEGALQSQCKILVVLSKEL